MIYWFIRGFAAVLRLLPRSWALAFGRALAMTLYLVFPLRQAEARKNIARAFPEFSPSRRRAILRGTYRHFCQALIDFIRMPGYSVERLPQLVELDEDRIRAVRESGQGLVLVTGHLGNWEVANLILGRLGYPLSGVVVAQRGSGGRFIDQIRDDTGAEFITRKTSTRTMLRLLKAGRFLGLVADQDARHRGVWVDFFGQLSSRPRGGAVFSIQMEVPIYFTTCIMGADRHYHVEFKAIDSSNLPADKAAAVQELTQRYTTELEKMIRRYPEQYFWFHRMWKTKPPA